VQVAKHQHEFESTQVLERSPVGIEAVGRRPFARARAGTLLLTPDELVVLHGSPESPEVFMRQDRHDLAMVRRPAPRGGERVELEALDGQHATLRFGREEAGSAQLLAGWLAGLPLTG
jgi:hypothetical protein